MKKAKVLSELAIEVTSSIDSQLLDCKDDCKKGRLSSDMRALVADTVLKIMDTWTPRLKYPIRCEILDWVQAEYGLCL